MEHVWWERDMGLPFVLGRVILAAMYESLAQLLQQHDRIGVISHFRPDGDAIGSSVALALALKAMGKEVHLWNEDGVPARYAFLEGAELMEPLPAAWPEGMGLLICVDAGDWKRLGDAAMAAMEVAPVKVNIDHHDTNSRYGDVNIVEGGVAATGFVLYRMFREFGVEITSAIATALYVAISTDTGSFQYSSTTPEVMRAAADLIGAGVDVQDVNRRVYQEIPLTTLIVNREVLNHMVVEEHGMLSHYTMEGGTRERLGITMEDTKDLVDIIRVIQGVKASVIFEQLDDGRVRASLRSKDPRVNVAEVAQRFGGGGHCMAAGIRMRGELADCRERVLAALREVLRALPGGCA